MAEKQQEKQLTLAQKQHEALALLVSQQKEKEIALAQKQHNIQALLVLQQRERDRQQHKREALLVQAQLEREKLGAEINDKRLAQVEADNREN